MSETLILGLFFSGLVGVTLGPRLGFVALFIVSAVMIEFK